MVLRKLTAEDLPAAKQVWMDAFGDTAEFVDYYFTHKFRLENSMGAFLDGQLVGDITMQDFEVKLRNAFLKTGFLAGCATVAAYRNQGIMKHLLYAQMEEMNRSGYAVCHLHPFKHAFYRKFGWETVSYVKKVVTNSSQTKNFSKENEFGYDRVYNDLLLQYNQYLQTADGFFLRSLEEMQIRVEEHLNDGGAILCKKGGYALYFVQDDLIDIVELVALSGRERQGIIADLSGCNKKIQYYLPDYLEPADESTDEEYTMMRIVNVKRLFSELTFPDCRFTISVQDDFCSWNTTSLVIESKEGNTAVKEYSGQCDMVVNISQLSALVAGKNMDVGGCCSQLLPYQKTCFFNTY